MAKPVRFTPKQTPHGWRLNIPAKYSESGKRERHFYPTRDKALEAAAPLKKTVAGYGEMARAISPSLAEDAISAAALLAPFNITILQAAQRVAEVEKSNAASETMERALGKFAEAKESKSGKYNEAIKHLSVHMNRDFAGQMLSTITWQNLEKHLDTVTDSPTAFNAKVRLCVTFWRWAATAPRQWCKADELAPIVRKEIAAGLIVTLNWKESARLLATAEKHFPDTVIPFAVALFTGMRQAEIDRLQPCDITKEGINVPAINDRKNNRRRFIGMPAPLAAWLKVYPLGETVIPSNWERKEKAVRRLAGWQVWSDLVPTLGLKPPLEATAPESAPEWPQNALRHTAASMAVALGKPIEALLFELGHTESLKTLRHHYIGKMPKTEAVKIWTIGPKGTKLANRKIT